MQTPTYLGRMLDLLALVVFPSSSLMLIACLSVRTLTLPVLSPVSPLWVQNDGFYDEMESIGQSEWNQEKG